jgi:hypothetical protein
MLSNVQPRPRQCNKPMTSSSTGKHFLFLSCIHTNDRRADQPTPTQPNPCNYHTEVKIAAKTLPTTADSQEGIDSRHTTGTKVIHRGDNNERIGFGVPPRKYHHRHAPARLRSCSGRMIRTNIAASKCVERIDNQPVSVMPLMQIRKVNANVNTTISPQTVH